MKSMRSSIAMLALKGSAILIVLAAYIAPVTADEHASPSQSQPEYVPLFNGENLDGWEGDAELWSVEDGVIVGSTEKKKLKRNSFLTTKKSYKNFVLKLKFKLHNGNSGVQVRSKASDGYVVSGYQADIADNQHMGILYEERGRGILANVDAAKVKPHIQEKDWNEYVITVDGPRIKQELNGFTTVDYEEKDDKAGAKEGVIALQVHTGPKMRVEFKDIEIQELP